MLRRTLLSLAALALPAWCAADPARDAAAVITELAASLTAGNVQTFMAPFDRSVAGYDRLREEVTALVRQGQTQSYVEVVRNEGDDHSRTIEATWELRVRRDGDATFAARPEAKVTCKLELRGKKWRIVEFAPVELFAP